MTSTFDNDNDVIISWLEKIISYARDNQYIFITQCCWWLASSIGLKEGLVIHIDNLRIRAEAYQAPSNTCPDSSDVHPDWINQIEWSISDRKEASDSRSQDSSKLESELLCTSEDSLHNQILEDCQKFLQESKLARKKVARQSLEASRRLPKKPVLGTSRVQKKPRKSYKNQTSGIEKPELDQRKAAGVCHRCAWPQGRKGAHKTLDCFRWARKEKGTAAVPKAMQYQKIKEKLNTIKGRSKNLYLGRWNPPIISLPLARWTSMNTFAITLDKSYCKDWNSSAKTKFCSLNLFSLLYPQTQINEIEVSLKYGIPSVFHSVLWVVAMLFSSITTSVPIFVNVKTSTWQTVHNSICDITNHLLVYTNVPQFDSSMWWWKFLLHPFTEECSSWLYRPLWCILTNHSYLAVVVHKIYFVDTRFSVSWSRTVVGV